MPLVSEIKMNFIDQYKGFGSKPDTTGIADNNVSGEKLGSK
jgi:hypothetical protein